ncbi:MAG TPA: hypothetical protein VGF92_00590 [Stellaceae bacterium]|jgi:hypothetical protein
MDIAYVSAFAALGGSIVGGLITGTATWLAQRTQIQAGERARQISHREDLFRDFIDVASKAYGEAVTSDQPQLQDLIGMYGMINRMQILCLPETVIGAQHVLQTTIETYYEPNKTLQDILALLKASDGKDPLNEFADAARLELQALKGRP